MDPLTAFSLASGVIQVVDFSIKTLAKCKEIYKEGTLSDHEELKDLTKYLANVQAKLDLPGANQSVGGLITPDKQILLDVARQCSNTADQLVEKLESLKIEGPRKRRQAISKTVKSLWEKGEIQEIQKRLDGYRDALDTQILISLRQHLDLVSLQNSQEYQSLDEKVQDIVHTLSQGARSFEELKNLTQNEYEKTREHIDVRSQEIERLQAEDKFRTRLLESLWFAEIHSREENIVEAHGKTFEWIFDKSGEAVRPWDNFIAWLESGQGMYWISGKAGSGKSTLMNFLCQDKRTNAALNIWSGSKDIIVTKFYFWSAGRTMQRSLQGLLRSLLWQILHELPDIVNIPMLSRDLNLIGSWTESRLQMTLLQVIDQVQDSCRMCFFIDGLDEFDEDDNELITFVQKLLLSTSVKICSSSRPHKAFADAFGSSTKLRLQDLTYKDIQQFVTDRFRDVPQVESMMRQDENEMKKLEEEIVARAEGVFLWVSLAVKDQIRGLRNEDSPEQLQKRLASLPSEVEGIYLRMLLQIDEVYRQEASRFLQIALNHPGISILRHTLASYKDLEGMLLSADEVSVKAMVSLCQLTRRKLITRCAGLLEVHESAGDWSKDRIPKHLDSNFEDNFSISDSEKETRVALRLEPDTAVEFVHRTAIDFLKNPGPGREFLEANSPPDIDIHVSYIKALLGEMRLSTSTGCLLSELDVDDIMAEVAVAEVRTGKAQVKLCDLMDRSMAILDLSHPDWCPSSHWCTRWGSLARMLIREQEPLSLNTASNSRSSSRDSFYSAKGEPTTSDCFHTKPLGSMNFLSFAALYGLSHYVQQMLDSPENGVSSEILDCTLWCSIYPEPRDTSVPLFRCRNVIPELLRRGANPNAVFFTKSIWEGYLDRIIGLRISVRVFEERQRDSVLQFIIPTFSAFIEYGADVSAIWTFYIYGLGSWICILEDGSPQELSYQFELKGSALSILQFCLKSDPELPRIREMCTAREAVLYWRYTIFQVELMDATESNTRYIKYELSEHASEDLAEIYENFLVAGHAPDPNADLWSQTSRLSAAEKLVARFSEHGSEWSVPEFYYQRDGARSWRWNPYLGEHMMPLDDDIAFFDAPSSQYSRSSSRSSHS